MLPKCFLLGNITADPTIGVSSSGVKYARLSVACSEQYSKTKPDPKTHYYNCVAWNKKAEYIGNNLKKGDGVWIEFILFNNSYTNSQGKVIYTNDLMIENIQITNHRSKTKKSFDDLDPPSINKPLVEETDFTIKPLKPPKELKTEESDITFDDLFNNIETKNE